MESYRDIIDASELTEEEFDQISQVMEDSIAGDYLHEMARLHASGKYTTDIDGWQALVDEAWATATRNNVLIKAVSAKSAERRKNRALGLVREEPANKPKPKPTAAATDAWAGALPPALAQYMLH